jgi:NDP-sugar pyrophosphorylase family protein
MFKPEDFFDLTKCEHAQIYEGVEYIWEVLKKLKDYIEECLKPGIEGKVLPGAYVEERVQIGRGTVVEPGAMIKGPAIIGENCEIRCGAYLRGATIVESGSIVGNSCELKNAFLHREANVPHFAYVGDSILGWRAHLGAGVKVSNIKITRELIEVKYQGKVYPTGLLKFGAIIGDEAEIGCNSVINPGTFIGKRVLTYTNVSLRGYYKEGSFVKLRQHHEIVERR